MDPRASVAVSPIYLESLRSYEAYASSDELFSRAAGQFGLRQGSEAIDKLKRSVLKVGMVRNTKILEIRVDWPDPRVAHQLAVYIADETVKLSQTVGRGGEQESIGDVEKQLAEARERADKSSRASAAAAQQGSVEQLKARIEGDEQLRSSLKLRAMAQEAEDSGGAPSPRLISYRQQLETLDREISARSKLYAQLVASGGELRAESTLAQSAVKSAMDRLDEVRRAASYRGERLRLLDPGVVPERPSFPNVPLIVLIGLLGALVLAVLVVAIEAGSRTRPIHFTRWR